MLILFDILIKNLLFFFEKKYVIFKTRAIVSCQKGVALIFIHLFANPVLKSMLRRNE